MSEQVALMTTREVAAHAAVTTSTVRRWAESGKLQPAAITPGGYYRFDAKTVDAALAPTRKKHGANS